MSRFQSLPAGKTGQAPIDGAGPLEGSSEVPGRSPKDPLQAAQSAKRAVIVRMKKKTKADQAPFRPPGGLPRAVLLADVARK